MGICEPEENSTVGLGTTAFLLHGPYRDWDETDDDDDDDDVEEEEFMSPHDDGEAMPPQDD
jgi:hypothetical protein